MSEELFVGSDWQFDCVIDAVGYDEIVDEVGVQNGLNDSGDQGSEQHIMPLENPKSRTAYQWMM
jgi:hypothetical protein